MRGGKKNARFPRSQCLILTSHIPNGCQFLPKGLPGKPLAPLLRRPPRWRRVQRPPNPRRRRRLPPRPLAAPLSRFGCHEMYSNRIFTKKIRKSGFPRGSFTLSVEANRIELLSMGAGCACAESQVEVENNNLLTLAVPHPHTRKTPW